MGKVPCATLECHLAPDSLHDLYKLNHVIVSNITAGVIQLLSATSNQSDFI